MGNGPDDTGTPAAVGTDVTMPQVTDSARTPGASSRTPSPLTPNSSSGDRPGAPLTYKAGDLVAERYRIIRDIGEGGMGEVYEAEDLLLKERVALKTLRDPVANDDTIVHRFKREIQLARKVTHPNVCRLFDVGLDKRGSREAAFLTMELLEGETLSAHIRRDGRLPLDEALPIAEQIAAGLAAAHAAGIIHRDLKCANVILVHSPQGVRAVVTDFGLARIAAEGSDQVTGDAVVGSPAYMAPEQVEGGRRLTAACDIYALGVVLFEMVTGRLPFVGETPLATAVMRLREPPPSPRTLVPDLDPHWESAILACLERAPEDRPANAAEVVRLLSGEAVPGSKPPRRKPKKRNRTALFVPLAVVICAGILVTRSASNKAKRQHTMPSTPGAMPHVPEVPEPPTPPGASDEDIPGMASIPEEAKRYIPSAVRGELRNVYKDAIRAASQGTKDAADKLRRQLAALGEPVDGDEKDDDGDSTAAPRDRRSVAILGFKNLSGKSADDYLSVAFAEMLATELMAGEELRTVPGESVARAKRQLQLVDADTYAPDTLTRLRRMLDSDYVVAGSYIVLGTSGKIRLDLKLQDTRTGETVASIAQQGSDADLAELVSSAGERLRESLDVSPPSVAEREGARELMPKKGDVARLYAEGLAQLRLENCTAARGPLEQAVATDPSYALAHASLSQVLSCLGYDTRALEEGEKAVELAANLPVEVRLQAQAHLDALNGNFEKATASYLDLYKRFPDNYDYGIAVLHGQIKMGDHAAARKTIAALRRLPPPAGDNPELDCYSADIADNAKPEERLAMVRKARAKAEQIGARLVVATTEISASRILFELGRYDEALENAKAATAIFQAAGDRDGVIIGLSAQARVMQKRGERAQVAKLLELATVTGKDLDSVRSLVEFHTMLGEGDLAAGDLDGAEGELTKGLQLLERHRAGGHLGQALGPLALVAVYRGDLARSDELIGKAEDEDREAGAKFALAQALFARAQINVLRGDLDRARETMKQSLEASPRMAAARADAVFDATLAVAEGRYGDAEAAARKILPKVEEKIWTPPFTRERLLVEALLEQGKAADAKAELERDKDALTAHESFIGKLTYATLAARVRAASATPGDVREAAHQLDTTARLADKHGIVLLARNADYERGRILLRNGDGMGKTILESVAAEADKHGMTLLAGKARKALGQAQAQ